MSSCPKSEAEDEEFSMKDTDQEKAPDRNTVTPFVAML